ncbi:tetratricopeptide repeat protein, partial [Sphingomonas bacterium]|uniref:tetratricopeptide repeat protein n=1 Tax=Sphingomonas bacterium TaxID=1895847 RepID=UPI0026133D7B
MSGWTSGHVHLVAGALAMVASGAAAQTPKPADLATLNAMKHAADKLDATGDPAGHRAGWQKVLDYARTLYPPGHVELAIIEGEFIAPQFLAGDVKGALADNEKLVARLRAAGPAYDDRVTDNLNGQLVFLMTLGRHDRSPGVAAELLARRQKQYGTEPHRNLAAAYSNAANAEYEVGNYDRALELVRRSITEAKRLTPVPPNTAVWLSNLPVFLAGAGRLEEAVEAGQTAAAEMATFLQADHPHFAANLNNLSRFQLQLGRAADAAATARRAVAIAQARFGEKSQTATYLSTLAQALNAQGKFAEARGVAEAAGRILERDLGVDSDRALVAKETLAIALAGAGDTAAAMTAMEAVAAARAAKLPPHHRDRIGGGDRMATVAMRLDRFEAARDAQAAAQALRHASLPADDVGLLAGEARLAAIEVRLGKRAEGLARASAATAMLDTRLRQIAASGVRRGGQEREARAGYGWALDAALAANDAPAAFRYAQRFTATSAGRAASEAAARQAAVDPAVAELMRRRQDAAIALERHLDRQLRAATRAGSADTARALEAERQALSSELARLSAELRTRAPGVVGGELAEPVTLDAARAALAPDEALLVAAVGPTRTALLALTRERVTMVAAALNDGRAAALVGRVRASVTAGEELSPFDFAASAELHAALMPPDVHRTIVGKSRLLIAANGPLTALPFAALAPAPSPAAAKPSLATARWLVRDHALVTLPSLATLAERPARVTTPGRVGQFVAVGAPALAAAGGTPAFRSAGMASQVRELPTVPASAGVLGALVDALGSRSRLVLTGTCAT